MTLFSKIKSTLVTSPDEEVVDIFRPVQYKNIRGILILTNERVIFAEQKGVILKSPEAAFFVKLSDLAEMQKVSEADAY